MKYSQKTLHSSPERARYGVSFVSSKGNILCRLVKIELYKIFAIINRAIKGLHCILKHNLRWSLLQCFNSILFPDNGHVLKMVNVGSGGIIRSVLVEDIEVFGDGRPILGLEVYIAGSDGLSSQHHRLKVVGQDDIKAIPLHRCQLQTSCRWELL